MSVSLFKKRILKIIFLKILITGRRSVDMIISRRLERKYRSGDKSFKEKSKEEEQEIVKGISELQPTTYRYG